MFSEIWRSILHNGIRSLIAAAGETGVFLYVYGSCVYIITRSFSRSIAMRVFEQQQQQQKTLKTFNKPESLHIPFIFKAHRFTNTSKRRNEKYTHENIIKGYNIDENKKKAKGAYTKHVTCAMIFHPHCSTQFD